MQQCAALGADAAMPGMRLTILSTVQGTKTGITAYVRDLSRKAYATKPASCAKGAGCSRPHRNSVLNKSMLSESNPSGSQAEHKNRDIHRKAKAPVLSKFPAGHAVLQVSSTAAVIAAPTPYTEATDGMSRSFDVPQLSRKPASVPWAACRQPVLVARFNRSCTQHSFRSYQHVCLHVPTQAVPSHKKACIMHANNYWQSDNSLTYQAQHFKRLKQITHLPCTASGL